MESEVEYSNLEFHEKLGEGGQGKVHRVIFKTPFRGYTEAAAKLVSEFVKEEVDILKKLSHPNIIILIGFLLNGPMQLILTEYAKYGSLHFYLSDHAKPLPDELKRKWIRESALGVHYLHSKNCLHRDIKASNCLLFEANVLKLCDFGLARETHHSVTMSQQRGTMIYMAPELMADGDGEVPYSKHGDIYSYGMLMLEICTRTPPFHGQDFTDVIYGVKKKSLKPTIPKDCPKDLAQFMGKCWRRCPKERPTLDEVLQILPEAQTQEAAPKKVRGKERKASDRELLSDVMKEPLKFDPRLHTSPAVLSHRKQWTMKKEIHPEYEEKEIGAWKVALCPNGNLVIDDNPAFTTAQSGPFLLGHIGMSGKGKGTCKARLTSPRNEKGCRVSGIAVTSQSHILVLSNKGCVEAYDGKGEFLSSFPSEDEDRKWDFIAVDKSRFILLGDNHGILSVHTYPDGRLVKEVKCKFSAGAGSSRVDNSKNQILNHFRPEGSLHTKVEALDYSGQKVFSFTPMIDEDVKREAVQPCGICCDLHDNIYVAMRVAVQSFTGHIHSYSPRGVFQQCIANGLYYPWDLSISSDGSTLVVANNISITVYSNK